MKFRIHGTWPDGTEDEAVIDGDTIEEIQEQAQSITDTRNWTNCWSEEL